MALRNLGTQNQIQQQQVVAGQQENQQRAMQLQDQQILRSSSKDLDWSQPDTFDKWITNAQQSGVSPQTLSQLTLQRAQYKEQLAKTDSATLQAEKDRNSQLQGHIDAIKGIDDPVKRAQVAQTQASQIISGGLVRDPGMAQKMQAIAQGQYVPTDDDLKLYENGLTDHNTQIAQQEPIAKAREANANAALKEIEAAGLKGLTPQIASQQIDSVFNPQDPATGGANRMLKARVSGLLQQGDVMGAKQALQEGFQSALGVQKDVAVATNPQIQQGKVQVAAAEGAAKANVEAAAARGSNAALAEVPAHLVAPASAAATKAGEDYAQAQSVSERLQAMMDAAKKGNVVSYQLIPEEGALQVTTSQGVHRINMAEIQNYGGGSLWQQMQGHLGKALTGESIPASVLSDMSEMQKIQSEGAQTKYNNALKTINQTYGAKFQPVQMDKMQRNESPGAGKTLSMSAIQQAAKDHGVSVEEATRQAKAAGYTVSP
jgi:hypothetical protein